MCDFDCDEPLAYGDASSGVPDTGTIIFLVVSAITTIVGIWGPAAWIAAISVRAIAFAVPIFAGVMWYLKCIHHEVLNEKPNVCMAGIVDAINAPVTQNTLGPLEPFAGWARDFASETGIFPFLAEHPSFTVVVKCKYWNQLQHSGSAFHWYNKDLFQEPVSPIAICFIHSPAICTYLRAVFIISLVFATVGTAVGYAAEAAMLGMALCAASVFCGILALLVFFVIAIGMAILGANLVDIIVGPPISPNPPVVAMPGSERGNQTDIRVGDLLAVRGDWITVESQSNAKAFWFVQEIGYFGHIDSEDAPGIFPSPAFTSDMANEALSDCPEGSEIPIHREDDFCDPRALPQ